jgi:hypothetical protein
VQTANAGGDVPTATPFFARLRGSRIVELQVRRLAEVGDVESLNAEVREALARAGPGAVICGDYRSAAPVSREVAHGWARAMRVNNREIVRSGLLLDPANTMFNLQIERVVRCSVNPARRVFDDMATLCDWLGVALSDSERQLLRGLFSGEREGV